jgi:tetratricopeptide (TPR) repeat protein
VSASYLYRLRPSLIWSFVLATLGLAAFWSIRFAAADILYRQNTPEALKKAVALAPGNASYRALRGEFFESEGVNPDPDFQTAAALSPLESSYWIRLGFRAEAENHFDQAEQYLLRAAAVDNKFDPRWALMNFYYRRQRDLDFWRWTERSFDFAYGDLTPLFRLAWQFTDDSGEISRHIPARKDIQIAWLSFLLNTNRLEASAPVARNLSEAAGKGSDIDILMAWWAKNVQPNPASALAIWNTLCDRHALPFRPLRPAEGDIVTNGDFSVPPTQQGYDWRLINIEGVSISVDANLHEFRIEMSGKEPEDFLVAEEPIPLSPRVSYAIDWDYQSQDAQSISGLHWQIDRNGPPLARADFTASPERKTARLQFSSDAASTAHLSLHYTRPVGSTLAEGTAIIRKVTSQLIKQ